MKTSYILLAIITLITLTGMVTTDVLLKQQYEKIDWRDPYQDYEKRDLPTVSHWVIEGSPSDEIVVETSKNKPQALVYPDQAKFYRVRQQGDTAFVAFTPDYSGYQSEPRNYADHQLPVRLVLRVPAVQTLRMKMARLTIAGLTTDNLQIKLQNSRLRTENVSVTGALTLTESHNSFTRFGTDRLQSLQAVVQDSSGIQLSDTQITTLNLQAAPKADVSLQGRTIEWLRAAPQNASR